MNKYQIKGMLMYAAGVAEEFAGKRMHDSRRRVKGYQRKMTGKAIVALGDARRALELCINAPMPTPEESLDLGKKSARQTSKL